ncbi:MAG: hypothetical protein ACI9YM_001529 [Brevundimonas sp.]|jgi:hypothetical protein
MVSHRGLSAPGMRVAGIVFLQDKHDACGLRNIQVNGLPIAIWPCCKTRMRTPVFIITLSCFAVAGCNAGHSAMDGAEQFGAGFGQAATAPMDILNLRPEVIPTVLLQAQANPYDMRNMGRCATIGAEVVRLDDALGPDMDEPPPADGRYMSERAADATAQAALGVVRDTTTDFIPGSNWIRRLSGAARHERDVQAAIQAGRMRRAFLKGMGMQRNCAPPAAPSWFEPARTARR